jgi:manganese/zinc/iron transport system permease protein
MIFEPLIRGPLFGSLFMAASASLMGVFLFVRRSTLLGEALSHATYPGVAAGAFLAALLRLENLLTLFVLIGGLSTAYLGAKCLPLLCRIMKVDTALCFILALFFGVGVFFTSALQGVYPKEIKSMQSYLYGQAATMQDGHILLYGGFFLVVCLLLLFFFKELKLLSFDPTFCKASLPSFKWVDELFLFLVAFATVLAMRSVGIVLLSALLVAPALAARQFTHSLFWMLLLAACFGAVAALGGTLLSLQFGLPTGPLIVLGASALALFSLFFAPKRGLLNRSLRILRFRWTVLEENMLKSLWRHPETSFFDLKNRHSSRNVTLFFLWISFTYKGWLKKKRLCEKGKKRAETVVRLHRLWEVYLVEYLGMGVEKVHKSAEEMEHILTPEIERHLTRILNNPQKDPHAQPIPEGGRG